MELKEIEEKMAEVRGHQKAIEGKVSALYKDKEKYDEELKELKKQYVLQSGAISEGEWEISPGGKTFSLQSTDKKHPKFSKVLQEDYHCTINFAPGIELHFSDWDIYFCFDTEKTGFDFIKKWKVRTNIDVLRDQKGRLETEIKDLSEFIELWDKD